mgnify:CR=1 FL=1
MRIPFDNTYAKLPPALYTRQNATTVADPSVIALNLPLADTLGIDRDWMGSDAARDVFAGNVMPESAAPLAQAYSGHQFGNWNPGLGDGRALLLGEVVGTDGIRRDIQLKGSGPTPYSRRGDGRAELGPVLREYLVSEAMHALGVPTTRALAAVRSGEDVYRDAPLPGAILTRVAKSHIRVGTFQKFTARGDIASLSALYEHTVARHYPTANGPQDFLTQVLEAQAELIAKWMSLGFIHGVMNTDNMAVSGETIDYGPCAFMDSYHPATVFSAIDQHGRYAYQNQPRIAVWNLAQFATALIPLMPDQDAAIETFTTIINSFPKVYETVRLRVFAAKIGISSPQDVDHDLIDDLLTLMQNDGADFTNTFANLSGPSAADQFADRMAFQIWQERWAARRDDNFAGLMAAANPKIIPRNHLIQAAIVAARDGNDAPFHALHAATRAPYADHDPKFSNPPNASERVTQTFCGT